MTSKIKLKISIVLLFLVSTCISLYAQPGFDDDTQDVPEAPINDLIVPALICALLIGCYFVARKQNNDFIK